MLDIGAVGGNMDLAADRFDDVTWGYRQVIENEDKKKKAPYPIFDDVPFDVNPV